MPPPPTSEANHELLISVSGKVDALAVALEKSITHNAGEVDKLWKHVDARDERLTNAIASLGERFSNFGRPNTQAIVSVCVLIGSIAMAFIAPIKADIARAEIGRDTLAAAALARDEKIAGLKSVQDEVRTMVKVLNEKVADIAQNGSGPARERMAVIEDDLLWMRGEKKPAK